MRWIEQMAMKICGPSFLGVVRRWGTRLILIFFAAGVLTESAAQAPRSPHYVVVLDAAHGGDDAGGTLMLPSGKTEAEKAYTLTMSVRLRSLLAARGINVVTTREADVVIDPQHRAEIADHAGAQACLTLHASMSGSGVHLFLSSLAPAAPGRLTPWRTAQAGSEASSTALAGMLNSALLHAGVKVTIGRTNLATIDSMTCPAVAVEVAPPGTSEGSAGEGIDDPNYEASIADALAAGLLEWRSAGPSGGMAEGQRP
jgi:N-acetylmuramoyl-L-alanine amidase